MYLEFKDKDQKAIAGAYVNSEKILSDNTKIITYTSTIKNPLFTLGKYTIDIGLYSKDIQSPIIRINNLIEFIVSGDKEQWITFELDTENDVELN